MANPIDTSGYNKAFREFVTFAEKSAGDKDYKVDIGV